MKKKKIFCLFLIGGLFTSALIGNKVYAEETTTIAQEEVQEVEEKSKFDTFLDEWAIPTISALFGFLGAGGGYLILKKIVDRLAKQVEESNNLSKEERDNLQKQYEEAKTLLEETHNALKKEQKEFETIIKDLVNNNENVSKLRELVALLVASDTKLRENGYAKKILNLLNEGTNDETREDTE